jgi:hypothetical protein
VLFCRGLAYCGGVESGGVIDKTVLPMIVPTKAQQRADALVREGLWLDEGTHYRIRSWDKWQDEHDAAAEKRRRDRDRMRRVRQQSRDSRATGRTTTDDSRSLDREGDVEEEERSSNVPAPRDTGPAFADFWNIYPRREGKQAAAKAFEKATRSVSVDVVLAGAARFRDDPNRDPAYTPHPTTWLNQGRWDDEPLPARGLRAVPSRISEGDALLRRWHDEALTGQMPELGA